MVNTRESWVLAQVPPAQTQSSPGAQPSCTDSCLQSSELILTGSQAAPVLSVAAKASGGLSCKGLLVNWGQCPDLPFRLPEEHIWQARSCRPVPENTAHLDVLPKSPTPSPFPSISPETSENVSTCPPPFPADRQERPFLRRWAITNAFRGAFLQKAQKAFASTIHFIFRGRPRDVSACWRSLHMGPRDLGQAAQDMPSP